MDFFKSILNSSFFDNMQGVSLADSATALFFALSMGLFIFLVYHKCHRGEIYSISFGVTLTIMTLISTLLILAVASNALLSLGMVGALSIVRFRAAVEEPMDIAFLFWAIASGIVLAAGLIPLVVLGSIFIGSVLFAFSLKNNMVPSFEVMVRCKSGETESFVFGIIRDSCSKATLKNRSLWQDETEISYTVRLKNGFVGFIDDISALENVNTVIISSNQH